MLLQFNTNLLDYMFIMTFFIHIYSIIIIKLILKSILDRKTVCKSICESLILLTISI